METLTRRQHIIKLLALFLPMGALFLAGCGGGGPKLPPEKVIPLAREYMLSFNFDLARNLLRKHEADLPKDHPLYPEFIYFQALSFWHVVPPVPTDVLHAAELLEEMIENYPDHELRPQAILYMGRIHDIRDFAGDEPDYEKARAAYQLFLDEYPDHDMVGEAVLRLAMTHIKQVGQADEIQKGVEFLRSWHDQNPDSQYASLFSLFLGTMYDQYLQNRELALTYYRQAFEIGFVNPGRAGINTWRYLELAVGRGLEVAGAEQVPGGYSSWDLTVVAPEYLNEAIRAAQTIITEHPRSGRGYEAVLFLRRLREIRPELEFEIPELQLFDFIRSEDQNA